jgi:hypothetical protein
MGTTGSNDAARDTNTDATSTSSGAGYSAGRRARDEMGGAASDTTGYRTTGWDQGLLTLLSGGLAAGSLALRLLSKR